MFYCKLQYSTRIFIFPLFFCFLKRKAAKEKGTGPNKLNY